MKAKQGLPRRETVIDPTWSTIYREAWLQLPLCSRCGRKMRPYATSLEEYPGTIPRANSSICTGCHVALKAKPDQDRAMPEPEQAGPTRKQMASLWTEDQHGAALAVCSYLKGEEAFRVMESLGLFDPHPYLGSLAGGLRTIQPGH